MNTGTNLSFLSRLLQFGLVPGISISVGLVFVLLGAPGEISLSNRKLLFGGALGFAGLAWHYVGWVYPIGFHDTRVFSLSSLAAFLFFLLLTFFCGYLLLCGRLPLWLAGLCP